jgi:hypothetical protein
MIKLKDILSETKVGYLVEAKKKKRDKVVGKKDTSDKTKGSSKASKAADDKGLVHFGRGLYGKKADKGKKGAKPTHKNVKGKLVKLDPKTGKKQSKTSIKKDQDKQAERKKLGKTKVQTGDGEVEISKILPPPFGNAKDYSHKQADSAKEEVHDYYTEKFTDKEMKKVKKRIGKNGKLKKPLEGDEKKDYDKYKKDQEKYNKKNPDFKEDIKTEEEWLGEKATEKAEKRASIYDPDTGSEWEEKEEEDWYTGDDGFGMVSSDKYGQAVADKRGGETQVDAMSIKLKINPEDLKKTKDDQVIKNKHGQNVAVTVFKNKKDGSFHAVDDEGVVYKSKTGKFHNEEDYEESFDLSGFPGTQTDAGVSRGDNREPDEWGDSIDSVSFSDLLDMLGLEDV